MLQDLVLAAVNEGLAKAQALAAERLGAVAGPLAGGSGLNLGSLGLPGF
jgi:DNA-binding protein YbaB